ncbi:MAG: hypothetical protein JNK05_13305 [Myxococcales bacterium]|nr:hypothetical protein [Myxococcales bacterium]
MPCAPPADEDRGSQRASSYAVRSCGEGSLVGAQRTDTFAQERSRGERALLGEFHERERSRLPCSMVATGPLSIPRDTRREVHGTAAALGQSVIETEVTHESVREFVTASLSNASEQVLEARTWIALDEWDPESLRQSTERLEYHARDRATALGNAEDKTRWPKDPERTHHSFCEKRASRLRGAPLEIHTAEARGGESKAIERGEAGVSKAKNEAENGTRRTRGG